MNMVALKKASIQEMWQKEKCNLKLAKSPFCHRKNPLPTDLNFVTCTVIIWIIVYDFWSSPDRLQTDRKRCIWAHHAIAHVGSKCNLRLAMSPLCHSASPLPSLGNNIQCHVYLIGQWKAITIADNTKGCLPIPKLLLFSRTFFFQ